MSPNTILRTWMPAIHAGMTDAANPRDMPISSSVGARKILNHFARIFNGGGKSIRG
jgi:hypothetical protein